MKKLLVLSVVVAFVLLGTQVFASPPVPPPTEGFIITSDTDITCDDKVTETETYNWTYFSGWGTGSLYPGTSLADWGVPCVAGAGASPCPAGAVSNLGFSSGAEVAYFQNFTATDGQTTFVKNFKAVSNITTTDPNNLYVKKEITFVPNGADSLATHEEKVGLSVVSIGGVGANGEDVNPASNLLHLCPWAASSDAGAGKAFPATNEGIAAGSSFEVNKLDSFKSESKVISTEIPYLSYKVDAAGEGTIGAKFVVELWEAPEGFKYLPVEANTMKDPDGNQCFNCRPPTCSENALAPFAGSKCYILPSGAPPLASRTSYSESASATGVWTFKKDVSYTSVFPAAGVSSGAFPFNNVP